MNTAFYVDVVITKLKDPSKASSSSPSRGNKVLGCNILVITRIHDAPEPLATKQPTSINNPELYFTVCIICFSLCVGFLSETLPNSVLL